jgi:hypothetical protein
VSRLEDRESTFQGRGDDVAVVVVGLGWVSFFPIIMSWENYLICERRGNMEYSSDAVKVRIEGVGF